MKIAFLSSYDPYSTGSWSGTPYYMLSALKNNNVKVEVLGPLNSYVKFFLKLIKVLFRVIGIEYDYNYSTLLSYEYAFRFQRKLRKLSGIDFIIAPAGSTQIANIRTNIPIVYLSDTTYDQLKEYYPNFGEFSLLSRYQGSSIEKSALRNATVISFPSKWATDFCRANYDVSDKIVKEILWGANINDVTSRVKEINGESYILLFLGVDWIRKGGDVAVEAVRYLREIKKVNARLVVCGCNPSNTILPDWVEVVGRLNKDIPDEMKSLEKILNEANLLLLPTIAECFGMVFCEAAAYGLPVVTTDTGGISSIVQDGKTGLLIKNYKDSKAFGEAVYKIISDAEVYRKYSENALERYKDSLNWNIWAKNIIELMHEHK